MVSLTWANNPSNVVVATGFTNVTGYTLTWSGPTAGTIKNTGLTGGATVEGLTSGGSYTFTLVANAPVANSAAVTATAAAK
jgi:hypothetical protein